MIDERLGVRPCLIIDSFILINKTYIVPLSTDLRSHVNSLKYDFKDASIKRMILKLPIPGFGAALAEESSFFTMGQMSKKLYQFSLPEEPPKKVCMQPSSVVY